MNCTNINVENLLECGLIPFCGHRNFEAKKKSNGTKREKCCIQVTARVSSFRKVDQFVGLLFILRDNNICLIKRPYMWNTRRTEASRQRLEAFDRFCNSRNFGKGQKMPKISIEPVASRFGSSVRLECFVKQD